MHDIYIIKNADSSTPPLYAKIGASDLLDVKNALRGSRLYGAYTATSLYTRESYAFRVTELGDAPRAF